MQNSIIDLVIRIKNGYMAGKESIDSPHSRFKEELVKKLIDLGYIAKYEVRGDIIKTIDIVLKYDGVRPAMEGVVICSRPGRRWYVATHELKSVRGGMGVAIVSTSKGLKTQSEAKNERLGGELLFKIW